MKKIFFIIIILYSSHVLANDSLKYSSAYEYLISNKDSIESVFRSILIDTAKSCFIVSNQIIPVTFSVFLDEIIIYEYSDSDDVVKKGYSDSIKYREIYNLDNMEYIHLESYSENKNDCELILFFGKIEVNKMMAEVLIRQKKSDDYRIIKDYGSIVMTFLFYFKENQVNRVFSKVLLL